MSNDVILNPMAGGDPIAADEIAGRKYQWIKVGFGAEDAFTPIDPGDPLPVYLPLTSEVAGNPIPARGVLIGGRDPAGNIRMVRVGLDGSILRETTTTPAGTPVAASAASVQLLALNASARTRSIANDSTADLYVKYGVTASPTDYRVKIPGGGYFEFPLPLYTGRVDGIWTAATGNAYVSEET